jgi:hypothetical protein
MTAAGRTNDHWRGHKAMKNGRRSIEKRVAKATFGATLLFSAGSILGGCGARDVDPDSDAGSDVIVDPKSDAMPDRTVDDARDGSVLPDAPDPELPDAPQPDVPSSRPDVLPDRLPDDARDRTETDVPLPPSDVQDADGRSCAPTTRVWTPSSTMVRLRVAGTGSLPPPPAPLPPLPCVGPLAYEFTPATRVLLQTGCLNSQPVHRSGVLSPADNQKLLTEIEKLETATCPRDVCWADVPTTTLTISSGTCSPVVYSGDDETGCPGRGSPPPFVDFNQLGRLEMGFRDAMTAVCNGYGDAIIGCSAPAPGSYGECGVKGDGGPVEPEVASFHPILEAAPPDVVVPPPLPEGGDAPTCVPALPVWNEDSSSFTMSIAKPGPFRDAGCANSARYLFSQPMRSLSRDTCFPSTFSRAEVELTETQVNVIVAKLKELRTGCTVACSPDPTTAGVTVEDCAGRVRRNYSSTEDNSCFGGRPAEPPHIAAYDLTTLRGIFDDIVRTTCDDVDAGVCGASCRKQP